LKRPQEIDNAVSKLFLVEEICGDKRELRKKRHSKSKYSDPACAPVSLHLRDKEEEEWESQPGRKRNLVSGEVTDEKGFVSDDDMGELSPEEIEDGNASDSSITSSEGFSVI
jgi:hypothetical protein